MPILLLLFAICPYFLLVVADSLSLRQNCPCGFYDAETEELFTDSIIAYFNETESLPDDFIADEYEKKYEKDWNAIYRQGADPSNLRFNDTDSLEFLLQPATEIHLVQGSEIRTTRQDIQHGSFRALMKSPGSTLHGSAMSMMWQYNETEVTEMSLMNTDDPSNAWVGTFVNGEFTTRDLGVNYSTLLSTPVADPDYVTLGGASANNGSVDPWNYTEYRVDWTKEYINFYVGGNLTRQILHDDKPGMPSVPSPFYFKHWSTGNRFSMEGPPGKESVASVQWIRMFFNSSTTTDEERKDFAEHCSISEACSMNAESLRGSTPFTSLAKKKWEQDDNKSLKRMPALWISVICISFSTFLLLHAFIRRAPWRRQPKASAHGHAPAQTPESAPLNQSNHSNRPESDEFRSSIPDQSAQGSAVPTRRTSSEFDFKSSTDDLVIEKADPTPSASEWGGSTYGGPSRPLSLRFDSRGATPNVMSPYASNFHTTIEEFPLPAQSPAPLASNASMASKRPSERTIAVNQAPAPADKIAMETVTESAMPAPRMRPHPPPPRQRVDYLAGLVAMCAVLVTVMHFGLTFVPGMVMPGAPRHHESEYWAQQLVAPFILNQMWLGVFFTTSVRFLVAGYLKKGNMQDVAKAAVRRTPRLMIPVATIALLEYFLVDVGATNYLRYIPSLTWSTWPYVTRFETFGHYISAILELVYLIPNAVPQITFNYCTGVLWTIAVQLQGAWLVLCGVLVIYEIQRPWKRMSFYVFCLVNHWYAQSWGSYLWFGLLLTDLDITYQYKPWLHKRPLAYYPLITLCWLCVAAAMAVNLLPNWFTFNFSTFEHDMHPHPESGEPLGNSPNAGYPAYYTPRLNGLFFAGGMQAIVELSPAVQWVLSLRFLLVLFPHIFTIYLLHGLVFWSWGSWLMIFLAERSFGYGVNVAIVGVTSYVVLFASLPVVTPVIEALGKDITALIWATATEKSPKRRRTLFPFPEDLLARREGNGAGDSGGGDQIDKMGDVELKVLGGSGGGSVLSSGRSSPSEKGKMKEKVRELPIAEHEVRSAFDR